MPGASGKLEVSFNLTVGQMLEEDTGAVFTKTFTFKAEPQSYARAPAPFTDDEETSPLNSSPVPQLDLGILVYLPTSRGITLALGQRFTVTQRSRFPTIDPKEGKRELSCPMSPISRFLKSVSKGFRRLRSSRPFQALGSGVQRLRRRLGFGANAI